MIHLRWFALLVMLPWCGSAAGLGAQVVAGRVTEEGSGLPVSGAIVRLIADGSREAGPAVLSNDQGRYRITAHAGGMYRVRVERIGFTTAEYGPVHVPAKGAWVLDIEARSEAIVLSGLVAEVDGGRCGSPSGSGAEVQLLWDEARKALSAAEVTASERALSFDVVRRRKVVSATDGTVQDERRRREMASGRDVVRSLPAEVLLERGYVVEAEDGSREYFAPDAAVLLSDAFLSTHCFRLVAPSGDEPRLMGLGFRPTEDRDRADIEGVMWLDREAARLRRLEFRFTGLGREPGSDQAEGEVRFAALPDGRWIVDAWSLRVPVLEEVRTASALRGTQVRRRVARFLEIGSETLRARGPGLDWRAGSASGEVRGFVFDSLRGTPLAGAIVRLAGRGWRARTDARGAFAIEDVPTGRYTITFHHPRLDSLGLAPPSRVVEIEGGARSGVDLAIPGRATLAAERCGEFGAVLGRVVDRAGTPMPGATVRGGATIEVTDSEGTFVVCADEGGTELWARWGPWTSAHVGAEPRTTAPTEVELVLPAEAGGRPAAFELEGLEVAVEGRSLALDRAGFYDRMRGSGGRFLGPEEVERIRGAKASDMLLRVGGFQRLDTSSADLNTTATRVQLRGATHASGRQNCLPAIYVDGVLMRPGGPLNPPGSGTLSDADIYPLLDDLIPAASIRAIEVYPTPSTVPVRFNALGSVCGVLAIWTGGAA